MTKKTTLLLLLLALLVQAGWAQTLPANKKATAETRNLYANLQRLSQKGTLFGHQDAMAYGIGWKYEDGRSDVKDVTGELPAVVGWDLGHLELGRPVNLDSVPFANMQAYTRQLYSQGGLTTFSWHLNNPLHPDKTSWDKEENTIRKLFADKKALKRYKSWLNEVAGFMKELKGPQEELIPVVFRPFHEHSGSWFWWGAAYCTPEEYIQFWRFTFDYLKSKGAHNLLFAYSPDNFSSREQYLERYPGDAYVDIVGFDTYHRPADDPQQQFVAKTRQMVETLRQIGQEKKKVWVLSETGLETLPIADWWTKTLLPIVQDAGLAYVLVWRNGRPDHYYAPYPGQKSAEDFVKFYQQPNILFLKKAASEKLYAPVPTP